MSGRRYSGLILDFAGVLTSNMVEVIGLFEQRERLAAGTFLKAWADPRGQDLYRRLEAGEIDQRGWNEGFGALLGIDPDGLMGRVLHDLDPAYEVIRVAREARAAGVRTAVLSNSLGREPYDPYAPYDLRGVFDVVVFSADLGIRKPDPAIFRHTLDLLGVTADSCVFADDTEANLISAHAMGMTVIHALDERETARQLRSLLDLRGAASAGGLQKVADHAGIAMVRELRPQPGERRG
jgi:putative hydrolase of the HAD superfamily